MFDGAGIEKPPATPKSGYESRELAVSADRSAGENGEGVDAPRCALIAHCDDTPGVREHEKTRGSPVSTGSAFIAISVTLLRQQMHR